uniref:Uncharacterized protein n=1 Tax=Anguilla anguilla TaxID=7936 RepID=A0A0E9UVY5_ANGAN
MATLVARRIRVPVNRVVETVKRCGTMMAGV